MKMRTRRVLKCPVRCDAGASLRRKRGLDLPGVAAKLPRRCASDSTNGHMRWPVRRIFCRQAERATPGNRDRYRRRLQYSGSCDPRDSCTYRVRLRRPSDQRFPISIQHDYCSDFAITRAGLATHYTLTGRSIIR